MYTEKIVSLIKIIVVKDLSANRYQPQPLPFTVATELIQTVKIDLIFVKKTKLKFKTIAIHMKIIFSKSAKQNR